MPICTTKDQIESFYSDRESHLEWRGSCIYLFRPSMDKYLIRKIDYFDWILCLFLGKFDMNQHAVINSYNTCSREHWAKAQKKRHLWKIWRSCQNTVELMFWQLIIQSCFVKKLSSWFCWRVLFEALGRQRNTRSSISKKHVAVLFVAGSLLRIEESLQLHWSQCITYTQLVPTLTNVRSHRITGKGLLSTTTETLSYSVRPDFN